MDISSLKKLGLSDKDIKVYLKLLEYGAISVRGLAEICSINRGTTYDILKRLQEIGLVAYYHQEARQKFVAEDPDKLLKLVAEEEERVGQLKNATERLVPELRSLQDKGEENQPTSKFYEGKSGIRMILEDVLSSVSQADPKTYYIYSATDSSDDINNAFPDFTQARIKRGVTVKAISLAEGGKTHGLDDRRWLGTHQESATFVLIYAGKCAFISRDARGTPVGVVIENKAIYQTQQIIFSEIWRRLGN